MIVKEVTKQRISIFLFKNQNKTKTDKILNVSNYFKLIKKRERKRFLIKSIIFISLIKN